MSETPVTPPGTDEPVESEGGAAADPRTPVALRYEGPSGVNPAGAAESVGLVSNSHRDPVSLRGRFKDPILLREALSTLHAVVSSDTRYVPRDRSALLAYKAQRKQRAGLAAFEAQRAWFDWLARNDPNAFLTLDPIVSVFEDGVCFEVFSRDCATYGRLDVSFDALDLDGAPVQGTTNVDFSDALFAGLQQLRSARETWLSVGAATGTAGAVGLESSGAPTVLEKQVQVPDAWLRGFLQVQSAATLATERFTLAPIDLYNALRHLRLNADQKRKGRGLRVELIPGEAPRLVLEPWEHIVPVTGGISAGRRARVVRLWGRRRLALIARLLPFASRVDVYLMGSGLPSFWVMHAGPLTLTLGLTGFSAAGWAAEVQLDLLLPKGGPADGAERVLAQLQQRRSATVADLAAATGLTGPAVVAGLQRAASQGLLLYDLNRGLYRYRPLLDQPLDPERFAYSSAAERVALDLLAVPDAVRIESERPVPGAGPELIGRVAVAADRRDYRPQIQLDEEGKVRKAECTCAFYRKHGMKEGPCPHLVALVAWYSREEAARRAARESGGRTAVTVESRTYVRRHPKGEDLTQINLQERRVSVAWGQRGDRLRSQTLIFDSVDQARDDYFTRVDALEARGFLDASAG